MYEDGWYSLIPDQQPRSVSNNSQSRGHRRKESLLQQPNGVSHAADVAEPLENVYEDVEQDTGPPEPELMRRAASYSDFYHVVRAQLHKDNRRRRRISRKDRTWDALLLNDKADEARFATQKVTTHTHISQVDLLETSQQEYMLYRDQLALTERHLDGLIDDANSTLHLLTSLADSFKAVEAQTSSFQSQCENLLDEQRRLEQLANDVGTDLQYYEYLDNATRRLNAPGASRMVDDESFGDMIDNIDACIVFMNDHEHYRDRDTYLARFNALLTKALHLLDHGFTTKLNKISTDIGRQVSVNHSESARHALAYGRFEELMMNSYHLIPNIHKTVRRAFDQYGRPVEKPSDTTPTYAISASNIFHAWFTTRDRDLKPMTQKDIEDFQKEVKSLSVETACRNFIKQSFERLYNEDGLFMKIFSIEPLWSQDPETVYQKLKAINTTMAHPGNISPLATNLQSTLQPTDLTTICAIVGWLASEYSVPDNDDDESPFQAKSREYAARLLVEHLWPFTDTAFEAEITKSISRAVAQDSDLKIGPVEGGISSSNAFPLVKRAMELLVMFDQSMPKDRSSQNSSVVFSIVRETIQVLQRAETRLKAIKTETDPDLFMIKNLLIVKNELVSLEIGDIRSQAASMQHFSQIWDTLSPQNWVGFFGNIIGGSLWSRVGGSQPPAVTAKTLTVEDMNEQLDELLRQSIYAFTKHWGTLITDSRARKTGVKPIAKVEAQLESILETAFSNQQEVKAKLKEAIEMNAQAQADAQDGKQGAKRY